MGWLDLKLRDGELWEKVALGSLFGVLIAVFCEVLWVAGGRSMRMFSLHVFLVREMLQMDSWR